jgi:hypothetical protein
MNPYQHDQSTVEQLDTERTVIIDPVTGETMTIGARIERVLMDATGRQQHDVLHVVAPSADGAQLLFPYNEPLYACGVCGARPLVHAHQCRACGRYVCSQHYDVTTQACTVCSARSWWEELLAWLGQL